MACMPGGAAPWRTHLAGIRPARPAPDRHPAGPTRARPTSGRTDTRPTGIRQDRHAPDRHPAGPLDDPCEGLALRWHAEIVAEASTWRSNSRSIPGSTSDAVPESIGCLGLCSRPLHWSIRWSRRMALGINRC